jgi:AI-2 transport protein TqsA
MTTSARSRAGTQGDSPARMAAKENVVMDQREADTLGLARSSLVILAFAAIAGLLYYGWPVLLPFVLAAFIFSMFSPVLDWMVLRLHLPRLLAMAISFLLVLIVLVVLFAVTGEAVRRVVGTAASYSEDLAAMAERVHAYTQDLGIPVEPRHLIGDPKETIPAMITSVAGRGLNILSTFFLMLIFVFFLLASRDPHTVHKGVYAEIDRDVRRYLVTKTILSGALGVLIGGVLWLFGVELALVFGLLAFVLDFIPSIGSVIATLLPIPVAIAQYPDSLWTVVLLIALLTVIQIVQGNLVEPKVLGSSLHLHPVIVLLAIGFWGLVWGIIGALLAVPLTAVIRLISLRIDTLRPLGRLLGGRIPDIEKH